MPVKTVVKQEPVEVVVRCLGCGSTVTFGERADRATPEWAKQNAVHNPGCSCQRPDFIVQVHQDDQDVYTCYTLSVFPRYRKD